MSKQDVLDRFKKEKLSNTPLTLEFKTVDGKSAKIEMITTAVLENEIEIKMLSKWRDENSHAFPAQFKVTDAGTKVWCQKALIDNPERVLFWVIDSDNKKVGHIGLFRISESGDQIEIDNIVRGEAPANKGIIYSAIKRMLEWQRSELKIPHSYLRVFDNNPAAIKLYEKLNYKEIQRVPLKSVKTQDRTDWKEIINSPYEVAEKYFVTMKQY